MILAYSEMKIVNKNYYILKEVVFISDIMAVLFSVKESYRNIVSVCDEELLGKYFEEGNRQLNIKKDFYSGEKKSQEEVIDLLIDFNKSDFTFNLVGKESVDAGIKAKVIGKSGVMKLKGIPFALSLL